MRWKYLAAALAACWMLTLTACGDTANSLSGESAQPSEPQTFGNTFGDAPAETAAVTGGPEAAEVDSAGSSAGQEAQDSMNADQDTLRRTQSLKAITAVLYCDAVDQLSFSPDDPMYFWRAVGYMAGLTQYEGAIPAGSQVSLRETGVEASAGVLGYTGEIPSLTEEDPLISRNGDDYLVTLPEMGEILGEYTDPAASGDGAYTMEAELYQNGVSLGRYTVVVKEYTGDPTLFDLTIVSVEKQP